MWDMVTLLKSSNLAKVKEIHLTGRLQRGLGDQIHNSNVQGTHHNRHSFIYVLRVLRALTEK